MAMVLYEASETACPDARVDGEALWVGAEQFTAISGWTLKPEGFCRGDVCIPVPPARATQFVMDDEVNLSGFWSHRGNAVVHDAGGTVWALGADAGERSAALRSLAAPDFCLPDLSGAMHTLHAQRGKKVLLVTWASW